MFVSEREHKANPKYSSVQTLQMLKFYKNQHVLCLSDALIEQHERIKKKKRRRIHPEALIWKPPVFTKDQLRFGW